MGYAPKGLGAYNLCFVDEFEGGLLTMKYIISLNGKDYEVEVEHGQAMVVKVQDTPAAAPVAPVAAAPVAAPVAAPAAAAAPAPVATSGDPITAPMPGTIVKLVAAPGAAVKKGQTVVVLEAMKMENEIVAPRDGVVGQILVSTGKSVATGDVLATLN